MKTCTSRFARSGFSMLFALSLAASLTSCALPVSPARSPHVDDAAPPAPAPLPEPSPTPVPTSQVPAGFYRVNPGDTQIGVAKAFGREPSALAQWNHLSPEDGLRVYQVLRVAPPPMAGAPGITGAPSNSLAQARAIFADSSSEPASARARLAWPVSGLVSTPFVAGKTKGIVIGGRVGEPVRAASGGRVVYAGGRIAAYGKLIIIKHDTDLLTAYGNNGALLVKEGTAVKAGDVIAKMGADDKGEASLRFEVRADGIPVDPLKYLPKRQ